MSGILQALLTKGAAGGGGEVDPTTISGCTEWVSGDQSSLSSLVNNDPVSTWTDRVGGVKDWTGSGTNRPFYKTGGPNGKPYLAWDSTDNMIWSNSVGTIVSASAYTMFVVIRPQRDGANTGVEFCPNFFGGNNNYVGLSLRNTGSGNKFVLYQYNAGYASVSSTTTFSQNVWYIVEAWYDGTNINIKVNNDTPVSTAKANVGSTADATRIGDSGLTSDIAERISYNVDIGSSDRTVIRNSLAAKYGITLP